MHSANLIKITNKTNSAVILWPKDEESREDFAILIEAKGFVILNYVPIGMYLDLDEFYFQFEHGNKKILVEEAHEFGIELECKTI